MLSKNSALKKGILLCILTMIVIMSTACTNMNYGVKINRNGTANLNYTFSTEKEMFDQGVGDTIKQQYEELGFTVEIKDAENGFKSLVMTKTAKGDEEIEVLPPAAAQLGIAPLKFFTYEDFFSKTYILDGSYKGQFGNAQQSLPEGTSFTLTMELPNKPNFSNATKTENFGKKLMWEMSPTTEEIKLDVEVQKLPSIILQAIMILMIIFLLVIIILRIVKKPNSQKPPYVIDELEHTDNDFDNHLTGDDGDLVIEEDVDSMDQEAGENNDIADETTDFVADETETKPEDNKDKF